METGCYNWEETLFTFLVAGPLEQMQNAGLQMGRSVEEGKGMENLSSQFGSETGLQGTCLGEEHVLMLECL